MPLAAFDAEPARADIDEMDEEPEGIAPPPVQVQWPEVSPGADAQLATAKLTATIVNNTDTEVAVSLEWVGDLGTTRTYRGPLDEVVLAPSSSTDVEIDLASMFPTLSSTFSGHVHLFGHVTGTEDEAELGGVIAPDLYFHEDETGDGVVAYDEAQLLASHRAGDFNALKPETAELVDEESDSALVRIVAYAEESEEAPAELDPLVGAAGQTGEAARVQPLDTLLDTAEGDDALYYHTLCVSYEVDTIDSGFTNSQGIKEDYWNNANSGISVFAHGVRVVVGTTTYNTNALGCVTFTSLYQVFGADVKVWAYATDIDGNYVRMHNGPSNSTSSYPGATYWWLVEDVPFVSGATTAVAAGDFTPRATAMATLAFSHFRYHDGIGDRALHVSDLGGSNPLDEDDCGGNFNYLNDVANDRSYIRLVTANASHCPSGHSQSSKFVVAHEYGHAYVHQYANAAETLPKDTLHDETPSGSCSFGNTGVGYNNNTKEWSSIAVREGFAHFVSARIWNDASSDGQFRWSAKSFDLERWNSSNDVGGHLVNECCPGTSSACEASLDGAGIITDWMRAFWDIHTDSSCDLTKIEMAATYAWTITQPGLTDGSFFPATQLTMSIWGTTCEDRWDYIGCWNGIDRQGQAWTGC